MSITENIANFINDFDIEAISNSNKIKDKAKELTLDTIGVALAASKSEPVDLIIKSLIPEMEYGNSRIWGRKKKVSLLSSILINGVMSHTLELDDVHRMAKAHLGPVVIPVAINLGGYLNSNGKEVLEAIILGYEVMIRIATGIGASSHRMRGWHATGTCGTFGSAAVASRLLKLNKGQTQNALGLAGTQSSGLWAFIKDGSYSKKLHPGVSAQAGLLSAFLAKSGFTGPKYIIEAEDGGLFRAMSDNYDYTKVLKNLGKDFEILNVSLKPFACCRSTHPAIEAIINLRKNINIPDIKKICIDMFTVGAKQVGYIKYPKNVAEAQLSLPYVSAMALLDGQVLLEQFNSNRLRDKKVLEIMDLVEITPNKDFDKEYPSKWITEVTFLLEDGTEIHKKVVYAKGDPENPLTIKEVIDKFYYLTDGLLNKEKQSMLIDNIMNKIETIENINILLDQIS